MRKIINTSFYLNFLLLISIAIAGISTKKPVSPYELISKSSQKEPKPDPNTNITALELLKKCTETLDKIHTSFITQSKYHKHSNYKTGYENWDGERNTYILQEFRTDGKRMKSIHQKWGNYYGLDIPESEKQYSTQVYNGSALYDYLTTYNSSGRVIVKTNPGPQNISLRLAFEDPLAPCFGHLVGDVERFDRIIKEAGIGQISVKEEEFKGAKHYVVEAKTTHGLYQIWLNPERGYNFSKATVTRKHGDLFNNGYKVEDGSVKNYVIENEEFKQVDDLWVPVKAKCQINDTVPNNGYMKIESEVELTSILINPDHDALNSFTTDDIKDGAMVMIDGIPVPVPPTYTWKKGKIVDRTGHEIDPKNLNSSLIGKALPNLAQFNAKLDSDAIKNKMILVCFWDIDQRPSRNTIQTLNKRIQSLLEKNDIYMVFIHAGPVEEQKFVSWLKENEIHSPVGVCRTSLPELEYTWGVRSLPWLIITDKQHLVTAEGFGIAELDEKIKK